MQVDIIGVPVDLGAFRRGVDMGPAAIRYSGLHESVLRMGLHCRDLGNIEVPVMRNALDVAEAGTDALHASFDLDVVTPSEAPGVGTPVQGGLTYREAHLAAELIAGSQKLRTLDLVELNPILDHANQTGELAVSLLCSLLGKRIFRGGEESA